MKKIHGLLFVLAGLLSACAETIAQQKQEALEQVQGWSSAQEIAARYPGEKWLAVRDDEYDALYEGASLSYLTSAYCPEDFRVFYGIPNHDRDDRVFVWFYSFAPDFRPTQRPNRWDHIIATRDRERRAASGTPRPDANDEGECSDGNPMRHAIGTPP